MYFTIRSAIGLLVSLLFFYKNEFGIKLSMKVDIPFNEEMKTQSYISMSSI